MPMGTLLFIRRTQPSMTEGQMPRGVYIVCTGRAKFSLQARDGKTIILKIISGRELMGLSAVISGTPSLMTVTTIELPDSVRASAKAFSG